jgi:hypothetical protein
MKKFAILIMAVMLIAAFAMPASALESIFGGYWRTRAYTNRDFSGDDTESANLTRIDTRTRLYYTAVLNDNLKFVNKFELDAMWGDKNWGDIGADGNDFQVKNSYVDFNVGPVNAKVGIQGMTLGRGFLFDDDVAGAVISFVGEGVTIPIIWMRPYEGGIGHDKEETDFIGIAPTFSPNEMFSLTAFGLYATSDHINAWNPTTHTDLGRLGGYDEMDVYYAGLDLDANLGMASIWLTGIYQGGTVRSIATQQDTDVKAYLGAGGLSVDFGGADVHGQAFYATGQSADSGGDIEAFFVPSQNDSTGQCYYWSEILGYGVFDEQVPNGSPADKISNIMAANVGITIKPIEDLSITLDGWYAALAEDAVMPDGTEENELGIEADVRITYKLIEGLKLDLVGAYLFAGDVITRQNPNDKNPYEIGTQLSLSF